MPSAVAERGAHGLQLERAPVENVRLNILNSKGETTMPRFYCLTCDKESHDETCIDCGDVGDELCDGGCGKTVENCECKTQDNG